MAATLKDVANGRGFRPRQCRGPSPTGPPFRKKCGAKVEKAAAELGYSPNFLARSLTTRRTKLIGLVSNNFHNPIFLEVFDLFTRGLQDRGLRPLLVNLSDETDPENSVQMLQQYSVDGVDRGLLHPAARRFRRPFANKKIPVVSTFGRYSSTPEVHVVGIDNIEAGRMAARSWLRAVTNRLRFWVGQRRQPRPKTG